MSIAQLRNKLHTLGYAMNYTFGITDTAEIFAWRPVDGEKQFTVNMKDSELGKREIEKIIASLELRDELRKKAMASCRLVSNGFL